MSSLISTHHIVYRTFRTLFFWFFDNFFHYFSTILYTGDYIHKALIKENVNEVWDLKEESKKFTYEAKSMSPDLPKDKVSDLVKMYDKFIDPSLRPEWLPIFQSITTSHISISSPSSDFARQHRAALRKYAYLFDTGCIKCLPYPKSIKDDTCVK